MSSGSPNPLKNNSKHKEIKTTLGPRPGAPFHRLPPAVAISGLIIPPSTLAPPPSTIFGVVPTPWVIVTSHPQGFPPNSDFDSHYFHVDSNCSQEDSHYFQFAFPPWICSPTSPQSHPQLWPKTHDCRHLCRRQIAALSHFRYRQEGTVTIGQRVHLGRSVYRKFNRPVAAGLPSPHECCSGGGGSVWPY